MKGLGFTLILAALFTTSLNAQFVRLEVDLVAEHTEGDLVGQSTYRVFALFEV